MSALQDSWSVILVRTQGPVNLGMIGRLCGNLGLNDLRLVDPLFEVDNKDTRRYANRAIERIYEAPVFSNLKDAIADCSYVVGTSARPRDADLFPEPKNLGTTRNDIIQQVGQHKKSALIFGNEATGLEREELLLCQDLLQLDTPGDYSSYNLSQAIGIALYGLFGEQNLSIEEQTEHEDDLASREDIEGLMDYWVACLEDFNYFRRTTREQFDPRFRSFINRMPLQKKDCEILRGMLHQMHYIAFERDQKKTN